MKERKEAVWHEPTLGEMRKQNAEAAAEVAKEGAGLPSLPAFR